MSDNILSDSKIKEIDFNLNYQQEPQIYISNLMIKYPNSYYLNSLFIYFDNDIQRIQLLAKKLEGIENTFALFGTALKYININQTYYIELIKKSINIDTNRINRWSNLKYYDYLFDTNPVDAENKWNKLVIIYPDFVDLFLAKAEILKTTNKMNESLLLLMNYENKYQTKNTDLLCKIGENYLNNHEFDLAIKYFNYSLKSKSDNPYAFNGLGWVEFLNGNYEKAADYYKSALDIDANEYEFCWNYANSLNLLNKYDSAYVYYVKAIKNCIDKSMKEQIFINFIDCLLINGNYKEATVKLNLYREEYNSIFFENKYDILFSYFLDNEFNVTKSKYNAFISKYPEMKEGMDIELKSMHVDMRPLINE